MALQIRLASYYLFFCSGSPFIICWENSLQYKSEFIRPCINMNKKFFSHFTETMTFRFQLSRGLETLLTRFQSEKLGDEDIDFQVIRVRRKHLWEDTVRSISKNAFKQNHSLKVHFIGEESEDEGGPKRDFLRLTMTAVCNYSGVLQGLECRKTFSNNPLLLERKAYFCAGLVTGMSLQ